MLQLRFLDSVSVVYDQNATRSTDILLEIVKFPRPVSCVHNLLVRSSDDIASGDCLVDEIFRMSGRGHR